MTTLRRSLIKNYRSTFFIVFLLAIFTVGTFFFVEKNKADENVMEDQEAIQEIKFIDNPKIETKETEKNISVPILMYHYIRDYNNPDDKIGTNLSVSPERFKEQIDYLKNNNFSTITFFDLKNSKNTALPKNPIILTFDDGYSDAYNAYKMLAKNNQAGVFYIISSYIGRDNFLNNEQIIEMSNNNMEIGSHTLSHPDLSKIEEISAKKEIIDIKNTLEKIIGKNVLSFCYPSGKYNQSITKTVSDAGYLFAVTTEPGISKIGSENIILSRIRINQSDSLQSFLKKIEK